MQRFFGLSPLVLIWMCACSAAQAADVNLYVSTTNSPRVLPPMYYDAGRTSVAPVGYHQASYHQTMASPSCGMEPQCCEHEPSWKDGLWDDYCSSKRHCRPHLLAGLHRGRHCGSCATVSCDTGCNSDCHTGCSSGCDTGCHSGCGCGNWSPHTNHGCDSCHPYETVGLGCDACCRGNRWGFQGCAPCCKPCYRPHCKPIRCWANSWCGELIDGYTSGHPPCGTPAAPCTNCQLGSPAAEPMSAPMAPPEAAPTPAAPSDAKEALPVPEKAARSFRFSPISTRTFPRGDVIK